MIIETVTIEKCADGSEIRVDLLSGYEHGFAGSGWGKPYHVKPPAADDAPNNKASQ